jgi:hypothetical protein
MGLIRHLWNALLGYEHVRSLTDKRAGSKVETRHTCHDQPEFCLKLMGYWAPAWHRPPDPYGADGLRWPDIRRAVRADWRATERAQLVAYLQSGHRCRGFLGESSCRFECRAVSGELGNRELTDGEWIWPEGLDHYVQRHGVMLPEEFVVSASARQWKIPPLEQVPPALQYKNRTGVPLLKIVDSHWLEWAKRLPAISRAPSVPDASVLTRFCLIVSVLEDPQVDRDDREQAFWSEWAGLRQQYG